MAFPIRTEDLHVRVCLVHLRVEGHVRYPVEGDPEPLPLHVPHGQSGRPLPLPGALHLRHLGPAVPAAEEEELIGRAWAWLPIFLDPIVEGARERQLPRRQDHVGPQVAEDGPGPDVPPGVRAPDAEGGDAGDARLAGAVAGLRDEERGVAHVLDVRVDVLQVEVGGSRHGQQHHQAPSDAADPSRGLRVAEVRLRAGDDHRDLPLLHRLPEGPHLDRVPEGGPRAVALRDGDLRGLEPGLEHGCLDALLLRRPVRGREAGALPVLVHIGPHQAGEHVLSLLVAAAHLEDAASHPVAPQEAVGGLVEGEGPASDGDHLRGAVRKQCKGCVNEIHAHDQ
mmetsp:Transcript_124293/g.362909  ORF Transcript_124293/g.362909 Transcript_124293/m.362909 type:complete len:338 (-) Transcript_124293:1198-2211(-)